MLNKLKAYLGVEIPDKRKLSSSDWEAIFYSQLLNVIVGFEMNEPVVLEAALVRLEANGVSPDILQALRFLRTAIEKDELLKRNV